MFPIYRIVLFLSVFLFFQEKGHALIVKNDTSTVNIKKPSPETEKDVFSDSKFNYKKDLSYSESPIDRFFAWLLRKLFGAATDKNASAFWSIVRLILIIAAVVLIVFLLFKTEIRRLFSGKSAETPINFLDITENLNELNIDGLIAGALNNKNYRLATRWWYLKLLKQLSQKEYINWKPYKTNFDYYHEMSQYILKDEFRGVSHVYEHVWYGDFTIDEKAYSASVEKFRAFEQSVNTIRANA